MAMRPRGGAQVPRSQFIVRPTYDDFEPRFDQKEEPTAHILHVYLPGFTREQLKVTYDESAKKIKARGERPLGNYRWSRFEKEFSIPDSCVGTQIKGKFEKNVLMITMPKKVIITPVPPKQPEAKKAMEEAATPSKPAPAEQAIPPKPAGPSSPKAPTPATDLGQEKREDKAFSPQKGKQDSPQKPTSTADLAQEHRDAKPLSPGTQDHPQKPADLGEKQRDTKAAEPTSPPPPVARPQRVENQSLPHPKPTPKPEKEKDGRKEAESKKKMETSDEEMSAGANKRIETKDVAAYAKEVMGKLGKRLRDDEDSKQSLINAGVAAIVIVAMGAYIAYTIGSGDTKN